MTDGSVTFSAAPANGDSASPRVAWMNRRVDIRSALLVPGRYVTRTTPGTVRGLLAATGADDDVVMCDDPVAPEAATVAGATRATIRADAPTARATRWAGRRDGEAGRRRFSTRSSQSPWTAPVRTRRDKPCRSP